MISVVSSSRGSFPMGLIVQEVGRFMCNVGWNLRMRSEVYHVVRSIGYHRLISALREKQFDEKFNSSVEIVISLEFLIYSAL